MASRKYLYAGALALVVSADMAGGANAAGAQAPRPQIVACTPVKTAAQLQAMESDLAASYCLANDIDLVSIASFIPIGNDATPFTGNFFGNNRVIRNLRIDNATAQFVGLFGVSSGVIRDVSLVNVNINSTASGAVLGGLAGKIQGTSQVRNVSTSGKVRCSGDICEAGGAIGIATNLSIVASSSSADVAAKGAAGGLAAAAHEIDDSFATGTVRCIASNCLAGGLVGNADIVRRSFATGPVSSVGIGVFGGLAGRNFGGGTSQSFATGPVSGGASSFVGGLIGETFNAGNDTDQCYAAGNVQGGAGATLGGLIGVIGTGSTTTNSYWDKNTSGQAASAGGTGLTTLQLRSALPAGFDPAVWAINKTLSYPFLNDADLDFASPLATLVRANKVFTFLPVSQLDRSQYRFNPAHEANASLASVYTMIARAVGIADNVAQLQNVKIDRYFWHDRRQTTTFTGPVTQHVTLGVLKPLAANAKLGAANVIGKLNAHRLVILRGSFSKGGKPATHWMLGTLYTKGRGKIVNAIAANDPWTGRQVAIDPASKTVIAPTNFPLADFKVNGFQSVTID